MRHQRLAAAEARATAKARAAAQSWIPAQAKAVAQAPGEARDRDVIPWLRQLGFSAGEARRAAARCEDLPDASLEERVRVALSCFHVRGTRVVQPGAGSEAAASLA